MIAHCLEGLPEEACGLLIGDYSTGVTERLVPVENIAHSALVYTVDPKAHMLADRAAAADGLDIIGVFHSHTHTEAYPSPTDVAQAPDPGWHYVLVSLRDIYPVIRSYRIVDEIIAEEPILGERSYPRYGN